MIRFDINNDYSLPESIQKILIFHANKVSGYLNSILKSEIRIRFGGSVIDNTSVIPSSSNLSDIDIYIYIRNAFNWKFWWETIFQLLCSFINNNSNYALEVRNACFRLMLQNNNLIYFDIVILYGELNHCSRHITSDGLADYSNPFLQYQYFKMLKKQNYWPNLRSCLIQIKWLIRHSCDYIIRPAGAIISAMVSKCFVYNKSKYLSLVYTIYNIVNFLSKCKNTLFIPYFPEKRIYMFKNYLSFEIFRIKIFQIFHAISKGFINKYLINQQLYYNNKHHKKKIFLSSRQIETSIVRQEIKRYLSKRNVELLMAEDFFPWQFKVKNGMDYCLDKVKEANYFIGIYSKTYGLNSNGYNLCPIHLELNESIKTMPLENRLLFDINSNIGTRDLKLEQMIYQARKRGEIIHKIESIKNILNLTLDNFDITT